jgi:hypothetical protein
VLAVALAAHAQIVDSSFAETSSPVTIFTIIFVVVVLFLSDFCFLLESICIHISTLLSTGKDFLNG